MAKKKEQKSEKPVKKEKEKAEDSFFSKTLAAYTEELGKNAIQSLSELREHKQFGLSSGSLLLDYVISSKLGGMAVGQAMEVWGPYSTGKTTVVLGFCANATANKKRVVYVDLERSLQDEMVSNAGIDEKYFTIIKIKDGRELTRVLGGLIKTGEVGVVVIDSLPKFKPIVEPKKGEDEADPTKPKIAHAASFQTEALDYLEYLADDHGTLLIYINQQRKNITGYGNPNKPWGSDAKDHGVSVRLAFTGRATGGKDSRITDEDGNLIGQYTKVVADKNKISIPMREAELPIFLGRGIDPYMELAIVAQKTGIVDGTAGRFKWADTGEPIAHGKDAFAKKLFDDTDLYRALREKCISALGLNYNPEMKLVNAFHDHNLVKRTHVELPQIEKEEEDE